MSSKASESLPKFSVISERPPACSKAPTKLSAMHVAVLETATGGGAVRIQLNGQAHMNVRTNLYHLAQHHGLRARTRRDGNTLIVWMEPKA